MIDSKMKPSTGQEAQQTDTWVENVLVVNPSVLHENENKLKAQKNSSQKKHTSSIIQET